MDANTNNTSKHTKKKKHKWNKNERSQFTAFHGPKRKAESETIFDPTEPKPE